MKTSENCSNPDRVQLSEAQVAAEKCQEPLRSPLKRVEVWSGRLAMMGFAIAATAIVLKGTV
jgi:hypothetical protein